MAPVTRAALRPSPPRGPGASLCPRGSRCRPSPAPGDPRPAPCACGRARSGRVACAGHTPRRACGSVPGPPRGRGTLACAGGPAVFVPLVGVWAPALLVATVAGAAPSVHVQVSAPALGASGPVRGSELPARTVTLGCVEKLSRRFPAEAERAQCPRPASASAPRRARGGVSLRL